MAKMLYILDFDRTVFDTDRFIAGAIQVLNAPKHEFNATQGLYIEPVTKYYNFHGHMQALIGIQPQELEDTISRHLGKQDYSYPDALKWIKSRDPSTAEVIIMTVGRPPFQELKFKYSRAVDGLRRIVVPQNKGQLIRDYLAGNASDINLNLPADRNITLIDDSPETFHGLGQAVNVAGIRLARPDGRYLHIPTPPGFKQITNFGELI